MPLTILHTDVLVLGAGLAGMRAAWSALETRPDLNVTVVSQRFGPSGSSFANINDKLGMQVCRTDRERENYVREATSIAAPGMIDPDLVRILAEESEARFLDLAAIDFPFDRDEHQGYFRTTGCFSPGEKRAVVFSGLSVAFEKLKNKFLSLGGRFMEGWLIQDLIKIDQGSGRVCGAVLQKAVGDQKIVVGARSVIVALGGPSPLFLQNVSGPGTHGIAYALLKRAGAAMVNTPYLQFMWYAIPERRFRPIQSCLKEGVLVRNPRGESLPVPKELFELAGERTTHCPVGYGLADGAVDQFFIEHINPYGEIDVFEPETGWGTIALMAHVGNGGAGIDRNGWTGVSGLYACGESAGGMHGANRIGGAMVTGTQVFGARAGTAAALFATGGSAVNEKVYFQSAEWIVRTQTDDENQRQELIPWLRNGMQEFAVVGGRPGLKSFISQIFERLGEVRDWRTRLAFEAAVIIGKG